jgi:hypothetical protein
VPIRPETGHPEFVWPAWRIRSWYIKLAHGRKRKSAEALLDDDDLMSHGYTDAVLDYIITTHDDSIAAIGAFLRTS